MVPAKKLLFSVSLLFTFTSVYSGLNSNKLKDPLLRNYNRDSLVENVSFEDSQKKNLCRNQWRRVLELTEDEVLNEIKAKKLPNRNCLDYDKKILPRLALLFYVEGPNQNRLQHITNYRAAVFFFLVADDRINFNSMTPSQHVNALYGSVLFLQFKNEYLSRINKVVKEIVNKNKKSYFANKARVIVLFYQWMFSKSKKSLDMLVESFHRLKKFDEFKTDLDSQELPFVIEKLGGNGFENYLSSLKKDSYPPYFVYYNQANTFYKEKKPDESMELLKKCLHLVKGTKFEARVSLTIEKIKKKEKNPFSFNLDLKLPSKKY